MNIDYIANVRLPTPRAHGLQIMKMCEAFASAGAVVRLITPHKSFRTGQNTDPYDYFQVQTSFAHVRLKGSDLLGLTEKFGPICYWIDLTFFLMGLWWVGSSVGSIIYTRDPILLLPFSRKRHHLCLELHTLPRRVNFLLRKAHTVVVLTSALKEDLIQLGIPSSRITVAPDGYDPHNFAHVFEQEGVREDLSLPSGKIALYVGHLYAWKGTDTLAEAARHIPDVHVVLVGGIEPERSLFLKKFAPVPNLTLLPFVSHAEIPRYLAAADLLVLPNSAKERISARYTSPLKLFEYMAAGKPIVASDLPSLRDILNESNATLVTPDDPVALAKGIQRVMDGGAHIQTMADNARKQVQEYTWDKRANSILAVLYYETPTY